MSGGARGRRRAGGRTRLPPIGQAAWRGRGSCPAESTTLRTGDNWNVMVRGILSILFGLAVVAGATAAAAPASVREIRIRSAWGGLGTPRDETITIRARKGKLERDGIRVEQAKADALIAALRARLISEPEATNLGITAPWIEKQIADPKGRFRLEVARATQSQTALLAETLRDPGRVAQILPSLFRYFRTDDYPAARVEVIFDDGSQLNAETDSQYPFMVPWRVSSNDAPTYNADISRAVANLLSKKSPNKDRLAGSGVAYELISTAKRAIERDWNLRGSEDRAGEALAALRLTYEVVASEIHPSHHPEYGTATYKGEPQQMNLHATLRKPFFPPGVTVALVLEQAQGKVEGIQRFLATAEKYEKLALSVPWLTQYMRANPRASIRISFVQDRSFGEKALRTFADDMRLRDRLDLVERVRAEQSEIVLLIAGNQYAESYWLLFPDKHMLLWRFGGPTGLLKWKADDFPAGECVEYKIPRGGCAGSEITPEGELAAARAPRDQVCVTSNRRERPTIGGEDTLFSVESGRRGGFIDKTGRVVIPLCFDGTGDFSEGLARFERDKKWGYLDMAGNVVIEPVFPWAQEFSEGLARVQIAGTRLGPDAHWGFINRTGSIVIDERKVSGLGESWNMGSNGFESAFHDGLAMIDAGGKKGYVDKTGKVVISPQFAYAYPFSGGLAAATESADGPWGFIDKTGAWAIAPSYEYASSFSEGLASVNRTRKCGYIDTTGTMVLQPETRGETDCATIAGEFSGGLARWKFGKKYGFIDRTGKTVIKPVYDLTYHFAEGLAAVMVGGHWGYIDAAGKMVIPLMPLNRAEDFHNGLAPVVTKDGSHGYVDRAGKFVWPPER